MVNRYDNPAEAQFINTYVPIPFEQLYALGKAAGDRIDKALTTFKTARDNWSKFQSESMVDNANWDKVTMQDTGIRDLVNQMAANPDLIKDSRYQMALTSAINNVDTAAMRNLQQSAKNFEIRKENIARLIAQNKYNEAWHLMNNSGWNTLQQGIFTDINPTPYQTSAEMVKPYLDDLKDSFLENKGGYNWYGVTKDTTRKQVDAHLSDILATPQAREYVKQYMRSGADYDTAVNMLTNQLYNASEEFARRKGEVDPYTLQAMRLKSKDQDEPERKIADLYDQQFSTLDMDLKRKWNNNPFYTSSKQFQDRQKIYEEITAYQQAFDEGQISEKSFMKAMNDYQKQIDALPEFDMSKINREFFESRAGAQSSTRGVGENTNKLRTYGKAITDLNEMNNTEMASSLVRNLSAANYGKEYSARIGDVAASTFRVPTSKGFMLDSKRARKLMNVKQNGTQLMVKDDNGHEINFEEMFENNGVGNGLWIPDFQGSAETQDGMPSIGMHGGLYLSKTALSTQLGSGGYKRLKEQIKALYGSGYIIGENEMKLKDDNNSNSPEQTLGDEYIRFDCTKYIKNSGINRMEFNQVGNKTWGGNTSANNKYISDYDQSYTQSDYERAKKILE